MNDLLEKTIKTHAENIFGSEPAKGHRERFAAKLEGKAAKKVAWRKPLAYAAAVALIAVMSVLQWRTTPEESREESPDEVQSYYAMQLENEVGAIQLLLQEMDESDRAMIWKDIEDIRAKPAQEMNITLTVKVYYHKIETLQHIQQVLANHI
jgi:hypothetical protein